MPTWHLIGTPTLTPTKRSAIRALDVQRPVQIVCSGSANECYQWAKRMTDMALEEQDLINGLPVITASWTYRLVRDETVDGPRALDRTDFYKHVEASATRSLKEWFDLVIDRCRRTTDDVLRKKADFERAIVSTDPRATTPVDVVSWTMGDITNLFNQVRLDLAIKYSAELNTARSQLDKH